MISRLGRRFNGTTDESGTALILALLVVLLVGALLAAVLDFTGTGFTLASGVRYDRNQANYEQGAVEGAINQIRGSSISGRPGLTCPTFTAPVPAASLPGVSGTFSVTCTGEGVVGAAGADQPDFAIQTLGKASADGLSVSGDLTVDGGVYSANTLTSSSSLTVYGSAVSRGSCTSNTIKTTDPAGPLCNYTSNPTLGADPLYRSTVQDSASLSALIGSGAGADPLPTCTSSSITTFTEGYYSEIPEDLANQKGCSGAVYHFMPGRYVFDWGVKSWDLGPPSSVQVIGGSVGAGFSDNPNMGTACDPSKAGVQFIFGGGSRWTTKGKSAGISLCGPIQNQFPGVTLTGAERFTVLYGLSSNGAQFAQAAAPVTGTFSANSVPLAGGTAPTSGTFPTPATGAQAIDATFASATVPSNKNATLTYGGFTPVPAGSRINSVTIRVAQNVANAITGTVAINTPAYSGPTTTINGTCLAPTYCDVTVPVSSLDPTATWRDLQQAKVVYKAANGSGAAASATVDGIQLIVNYTPPALQPQTCGAGCTFLDDKSNPNVFMKGTVYTPAVSWSVLVHNMGETIFSRGIIVRDLDASVSASSKQTDSPFQLPTATPVIRRVLFKGYLDSTLKIRACVVYTDTAPVSATESLAFPGWSVQIVKWTSLRSPVDADSCA